MLRFSVFDETPHKRPTANLAPNSSYSLPPDFWVSPNSATTAGPSVDSRSQSQTTPRPISSFYIPPPPVMFSVPPRAFSQAPMDVDPVLVNVSNQNSHSIYSDARPPPSPLNSNKSRDSGCCSLAQSKTEIQTLLHTFQSDLDRILNSTFGRSSGLNQSESNNYNQTNSSPPMSQSRAPVNNPFFRLPPLPLFCSSCSVPVVGRWYTCTQCHVPIVSSYPLLAKLN